MKLCRCLENLVHEHNSISFHIPRLLIITINYREINNQIENVIQRLLWKDPDTGDNSFGDKFQLENGGHLDCPEFIGS